MSKNRGGIFFDSHSVYQTHTRCTTGEQMD